MVVIVRKPEVNFLATVVFIYKNLVGKTISPHICVATTIPHPVWASWPHNWFSMGLNFRCALQKPPYPWKYFFSSLLPSKNLFQISNLGTILCNSNPPIYHCPVPCVEGVSFLFHVACKLCGLAKLGNHASRPVSDAG